MNYRHSFHAGNFADVFKHAVLIDVLMHLKQKSSPFRVVDTHAGRGMYDLAGDADRTQEWRGGIARVFGMEDEQPPALAELRRLVSRLNPDGTLRVYPGSPAIARQVMRSDDVLVANELHPEDHAALEAAIAREPATKVMQLDAWVALRSLLPPRERRGLILIDPPFEQPDEFDRIVGGCADGLNRFATGIFLVWYPIKDRRAVTSFYSKLHEAVSCYGRPALALELDVGAAPDFGGLRACGLIAINPPFQFAERAAALGQYLAVALRAGDGNGFSQMWLLPPK